MRRVGVERVRLGHFTILPRYMTSPIAHVLHDGEVVAMKISVKPYRSSCLQQIEICAWTDTSSADTARRRLSLGSSTRPRAMQIRWH